MFEVSDCVYRFLIQKTRTETKSYNDCNKQTWEGLIFWYIFSKITGMFSKEFLTLIYTNFPYTDHHQGDK